MATVPATEGETQERARREIAQRVFAAEFNGAKHSFKEAGERSPRYVVSPQGSKINRLFAVGVITRVEPAGSQPGSFKATLVDPTGSFSLWAGQFEPEAAAQLGNIHPPCIVGVIGKAAAREFEGSTFINLRPESIRVVEKKDRDAWVLDVARHSMVRLDAMREAMKLETPTAAKLVELGFPADVSDGVVRALQHYGKPELDKYAQLIRDALETLLPGGAEKILATPEFAPAAASYSAPTPAASSQRPATPASAAAKENPHKDLILGFVASLDDGKGAPWEDIVASAAKKSVREEVVEETLNALMDDGLIYEPVLGRLKKT